MSLVLKKRKIFSGDCLFDFSGSEKDGRIKENYRSGNLAADAALGEGIVVFDGREVVGQGREIGFDFFGIALI